jgi:hypothetical protein
MMKARRGVSSAVAANFRHSSVEKAPAAQLCPKDEENKRRTARLRVISNAGNGYGKMGEAKEKGQKQDAALKAAALHPNLLRCERRRMNAEP